MLKIRVLNSNSDGNCYLLYLNNNKVLIIECGVSFKEIQKALNFNFSNVIGCIVSHEHKDHAKSLKLLLEYGVKVFASQGTFNALNVENNAFMNVVANKKKFNIEDVEIFPFDIEHDCNEPLGFVIMYQGKKLLFATDTYRIKYLFKNIDYVMLECNYDIDTIREELEQNEEISKKLQRVVYSHMELQVTKTYLKNIENERLKNVLLIHTSESNLHKQFALETIQNAINCDVAIAKKGNEYVLQKIC